MRCLPFNIRSLSSCAAFLLLEGIGAACVALLSCITGMLGGETPYGTGGGLAAATPTDIQRDTDYALLSTVLKELEADHIGRGQHERL